MKCLLTAPLHRIHERFKRLYGVYADACMNRLLMVIGRYGIGHIQGAPPLTGSTEKDLVLITYGDMVRDGDTPPLAVLHRLLNERAQDAINTVHVLPFFPYSSDDGFSVIDYREVDPALGSWEDLQRLSLDYRPMADLVLNHVSRRSRWFQDYIGDIAPARGYFIEMDPATDLSSVVRPRSSPVLTPVATRRGQRHVWTTFSSDQVDLNFANTDVLFEFLDILFMFISVGIRVIRLDAIAYLWKRPGTSCIHLPETHEVVKLFRDVLDLVAPDVVLLTETNVPHHENVSYFGKGDEAHMVYQFSLPPLLLHALHTGDASTLTRWAHELEPPPEGCTFLNFTASHDGIGVRPLEGLVSPEALVDLGRHVRARGGQVSMKRNADGSESPYELNITYLDALGEAGVEEVTRTHLHRFLCSQTIPLALQGVPAVYFNSLFGAQNNVQGMEETGRARTLNRGKWEYAGLQELLADADSVTARVYTEYMRRIRQRVAHPAFHPGATQTVHAWDPRLFVVERERIHPEARVLCLHNVSHQTVRVNLRKRLADSPWTGPCRNLLSGKRAAREGRLELDPYRCVWLVPDAGAGKP